MMFSELKEIIDYYNLSNIDELFLYTEFAQGCKHCVPYIEFIFNTGLTNFDIIKINS